nr:hypothetical protein [Candidatus Freyarchaeota archaeon]
MNNSKYPWKRRSLEIVGFDTDDMLTGARNMLTYHLDFNDGVNVAIMERNGISEVYSNDKKHLGKVDFLKLIFK